MSDDDVIICDPEAEYAPLVERFGGQIIRISPSSSQYVNPMDINLNYSEEDNPVALKADFILSLYELVVGGKEGLQPVEKTVIDRCVHQIYQKYFEDPRPENMPLLQDLYEALLKQEEKEARHVATALEIYVTGSLNIFNHRTNVDITNRIVCFDIKDLGKQMKKIGMLVVQDQVWGRVTQNRTAGKATRYFMDEFHLLLKEEQTAAYSVEIWKRFRKWGGIPTGILNLCMKFSKKLKPERYCDLPSGINKDSVKHRTPERLLIGPAQGSVHILPAVRQNRVQPFCAGACGCGFPFLYQQRI